MKMSLIYSIFLAQVIPVWGFANEFCPEDAREVVVSDMRSEFGPLRDQKDSGWCYANATADLLQYHLRNNNFIPKTSLGKISDLISAPQYAIEHSRLSSKNLYGEANAPLQSYFNSEKLPKQELIEKLNKIAAHTTLDGEDYKIREGLLTELKKSVGLKDDRNDFCSNSKQSKNCYYLTEQELLQDLKKCRKSDCKTLNELDTQLKKISMKSSEMFHKYIDKLQELISALDEQKKYGGFPNGGDLNEAVLQSMIRQGVCLEKDLPQNSNDNADENSFRLKYLIEQLAYSVRDNNNLELRDCYARQLLPFVVDKNISDILNKLSSSLIDLDEILIKNCQKNKIKMNHEPIEVKVRDLEISISSIDNSLQSYKPIFMVYDPQRAYYVSSNGNPFTPSHASLLVGKVKCTRDNGQSEDYYVLRNSFGKNLCQEKKEEQVLYYKKTNSYFLDKCIANLKNRPMTAKQKEIFCVETSLIGTDEAINLCDKNGYQLITKSRLERSLNIGGRSYSKVFLQVLE